MSDKIVEAVGKGRANLRAALGALAPKPDGKMQPSIARVRVQKVRDGKVYEDRVEEFKVNGFHG